MNQMISYIFETLQKNEATLKQVRKSIKRQSRANTWLLVVGAGYLWVAEYRRKEQEKKIKELREEIDSLRCKEVESDE